MNDDYDDDGYYLGSVAWVIFASCNLASCILFAIVPTIIRYFC